MKIKQNKKKDNLNFDYLTFELIAPGNSKTEGYALKTRSAANFATLVNYNSLVACNFQLLINLGLQVRAWMPRKFMQTRSAFVYGRQKTENIAGLGVVWCW